MADWLDSVAGPGYTMAIFWTFGALLLLLVLLLIVKLVRSMTFGTFVAGGRNRKTRLAVMDATAVDSHRRLVLVRRDDIEHLLLIGGPTDVVVERDIRLGQQRRVAQPSESGRDTLPHAQAQAPQPTPPAPPAGQAPRPRAPEPAPVRQAPAPRPAPERPQAAAQQRQPEPPPASRPTLRPEAPARLPPPSTPFPSPARAEPRSLPPMPQAAPFNPSTRVAPPPEEFDDELLKELEVSLEETTDRTPRRPTTPSLDDEMTKLLGELSTPRR